MSTRGIHRIFIAPPRGQMEIFQPQNGRWSPVECFQFNVRSPLTLLFDRIRSLQFDDFEFADVDFEDGFLLEEDTFVASGWYSSGPISAPVRVTGLVFPDQRPPERRYGFRPRGADASAEPLLLPWEPIVVNSDEVVDQDHFGRLAGQQDNGEEVELEGLPFFALTGGCGFFPSEFHQLDYGYALPRAVWWAPGPLEVRGLEAARDLNGNQGAPLASVQASVLELPEPGDKVIWGELTDSNDRRCPDCFELLEDRWVGQLTTLRSTEPITAVEIVFQAFSDSCDGFSKLEIVVEGQYGEDRSGQPFAFPLFFSRPDEGGGCSTNVGSFQTRQLTLNGDIDRTLHLSVEAKVLNLPGARLDIRAIRPLFE
ncbi:MAG: hypothetical protein AAF627_22175 [Myxococcota bacterium]